MSCPPNSINPTSTVQDNSSFNYITVINTDSNNIEVVQPITNVVQIATGPLGPVGPQGPSGSIGPSGSQGPIGPSGSSAPFTYVGNNVWNTTSSIQVTGSFIVSGSNTFRNIGPAQFTGSVNILGNQTISGSISASGDVVASSFTGSLLGTASFASTASFVSSNFQYEIHVSQVDGNDTTGNGDLLKPVATIGKALLLVSASVASTDRRTIIVHPGTYIENITINTTNTYFFSTGVLGANCLISGSVTISAATRMSGIKMTNLIVSSSNPIYINNCAVDKQMTVSGSGYLEVQNTSLQCTSGIQVVGPASSGVIFENCSLYPLTVNNASAAVYVISCNQAITPTLTAGALTITRSTISSLTSGATSTALTTAAGSVLVLESCNVYNSLLTSHAAITANGFYSIKNVIYNRSASTLASLSGTGGPLATVSQFQYINADNINSTQGLTVTGSLNITGSQTITGSTTSTLGFTGSLQGTASYASNALSSSYALTASYASNVPVTASYAISSSYAISASYALNSTNAANSSTAISASHALNADNAANAAYAASAGNGGVTQIIAGAGITLIPTSGQGAVTVISSGGGGVTIISGSLITGSFTNTTSYTFNHNLSTRTPIITVFDNNYNQIIPQNIQLIDTSSAIITFPTQESGFAIGSTGGTTGTVLSSSYAQFSTYASTASYYTETDPVFVAKSGSFATTGSNVFRGNQTVTGSLFTSGSNVLVGNTTLSGSLEVSGSTILHNSIFIVTGSTYIKGVTQISGSTNITGSFNVTDGDINIVSGSSFTRWGNKLFNYGVFSSTTTQSGSANTVLSMSFNNTDVGGAGVSLVDGSKITVENTGVYNLQFSSQFNRTNSGTDTITIWFAYTGSNVANSATDVVLTGGASVNAIVASWNYVLPMSASSYIQIYWSTPDTHVEMSAVGTRTGPVRPAVPSVIATLTQIA
jgi:hypothetical protein